MDFRLLILAFLFLVKASFAANIITTLPGYSGELPFPLESGYVGVGKNEEAQLFYLYAASKNPTKNPILLWTLGGPGCSSVTSFFFEQGPLKIDYDNYPWDGSLPTLLPDKYSWTEYFNLIFLDAPAGNGFSYATTAEGWLCNDWLFAEQMDQFLRQWLLDEHPELLNNPLYLGGNGYAGNQIPMAIQTIYDANVAGAQPFLNIKGYVLANPAGDKDIDWNGRYTFANRLALVSNELYKEADVLCSGSFFRPPNDACNEKVQEMAALWRNINLIQVINPGCKNVDSYLKLKSEDINAARKFLKDEYDNFRALSLSQERPPTRWCRKYEHELLEIWANDQTVQKALHVAEGVPFQWINCNRSIILDGGAYDPRVGSVIDYHKNLTKLNLRGIILSGDHDLETSWLATETWVDFMELPLIQKWSAVIVDTENAGYVRKYSNGHFNLTFTTIKGGSHYPSEDKEQECYEMVKRWLAYDDLLESA